MKEAKSFWGGWKGPWLDLENGAVIQQAKKGEMGLQEEERHTKIWPRQGFRCLCLAHVPGIWVVHSCYLFCLWRECMHAWTALFQSPFPSEHCKLWNSSLAVVVAGELWLLSQLSPSRGPLYSWFKSQLLCFFSGWSWASYFMPVSSTVTGMIILPTAQHCLTED